MRAVSAITSASNGGPEGGISSEETRGAIQPIISTGMQRLPASNLDGRGPVNVVDRFCQRRFKLGIAHRTSQILGERSREARDHAVIGGEASAGVGSRIAARKRDNPSHAL